MPRWSDAACWANRQAARTLAGGFTACFQGWASTWLAYGSSDWDITPREGRYRDRDADVLRTLLAWIHDEGAQQPAIEPAGLAHWYAERRARIESSELGMIVHQLDVVATRRAGSRALT